MKRLFVSLNRALGNQVPEQRIYMRSDKSTRYVRLSPLAQTTIGAAIAVTVCWSVIASSALLIDKLTANSEGKQSAVIQIAFQDRLEQISGERDQRALEAQTAQERFYIALEQISEQQSDLLEAEEERRELATGIKIMQRKLQAAVKDRDIAQKKSDSLLNELQTVSGSIDNRIGNAEDVQTTLSFVTDALGTTSQERDAVLMEHKALKDRVAEMEFDSRLLQERGDQIFARLEEAVDVSLGPLKSNLNRSGISVDNLINEVSRGYSGTGGPMTPLVVSSKSIFDDQISNRANKLLKDLDRVNLLKLAARKVPLGHPVAGSFRYTSGFGYRSDPKTGGRRLHKGRDMAGPRGTPIVATADGVVTFSGRQSGYGNLVKIRHSQGFETFYAHLNAIRVKNGQRVSRGDRIGDMGNTGRSTGVHLHYEIRVGGQAVNPANYMRSVN
ncbi:peptidase M23 [Amylibacter kogurei]|uniref:Peptidase M23 n=1 Tax=Paramylibacter kogurei TaxID=1889778 RepID=A0A2G5K709_9RHOB|nr:DUF5930 domain-containing protein [Amylibacter kogurei]PIB24792.1 peptidase M23 [Amylibacter kogurei]